MLPVVALGLFRQPCQRYYHTGFADYRLTCENKSDSTVWFVDNNVLKVAEENAISIGAAKSLVAAFESIETPSLAEVRTLLNEIRRFNNPVPVLGAAEALVTAGDLRLINSETARSEITRYLARGRDFFLVPLYQSEASHEDLVLRMYILALRNGISAPAHSKMAPDVEAFLADTDAYAIAMQLAGTKHMMLMYRDGVAEDSTKLRESLEQLVLTE